MGKKLKIMMSQEWVYKDSNPPNTKRMDGLVYALAYDTTGTRKLATVSGLDCWRCLYIACEENHDTNKR